MRIKWNETGKITDQARPDALRAIRRGRATLVEEDQPKPMAAKPEPKPKPADK